MILTAPAIFTLYSMTTLNSSGQYRSSWTVRQLSGHLEIRTAQQIYKLLVTSFEQFRLMNSH